MQDARRVQNDHVRRDETRQRGRRVHRAAGDQRRTPANRVGQWPDQDLADGQADQHASEGELDVGVGRAQSVRDHRQRG